jgi:hypothetical protein
MQHDLTPVRGGAMLEQVDSLPSSKDQPLRGNGNGKLRWQERGSYMRRHVVGTFTSMNVARAILGRDLCKKSFEIGTNIGVGVLLNKKRGGGVAAENRQKTGGDVLPGDPGRHLRRDLDETLAMSLNLEAMERLTHWNNQGFEGFPGWDFK